jgi:hypothetical protein
MTKIVFEIEGKPGKDTDKVILKSINRIYGYSIISHKNNYTYIYIPVKYFENNFKFNHKSWIYETDITWKDLKENSEIETWFVD